MIDPRSTLAATKSSSFLSGLEEGAKDSILAAAEIRRISAKQNITTGGHSATVLFLVQDGRVRYYHVTKGGDLVLLAWLGPGDVIGLGALVKGPMKYMATAEATSNCELLVWKQPLIRELLIEHPLLGENALRIALGYLRNYVDRHIALATTSAEKRLAGSLLRLGEQSREIHSNGIEIQVTNDQLAALADISPFTACRVLSNWARAGTVSKKRGRVFLHAPEALMID